MESLRSQEYHFFFAFFPPDFLPPEDLGAADFLEADFLALAGDFPFAPFLGFWTCPPPTGAADAAGVGVGATKTFFDVPLIEAPYDVVLVENIVRLSENEALTF